MVRESVKIGKKKSDERERENREDRKELGEKRERERD